MYDIAEFQPPPADQLTKSRADAYRTECGCVVESRRTLNLRTGALVEHITLSHPGHVADVAWASAGDREFCRLFESVHG